MQYIVPFEYVGWMWYDIKKLLPFVNIPKKQHIQYPI